MTQEKVTREELEAIKVGKFRIFNLINEGKVKSAISTCYQLMNDKGLEFEWQPDWKAFSILIKRIK